MNNPFIYGHPVSPADFFNRLHALRRVVGRLLSAGQSTGIIGQPRTGKTSLLRLLGAPEMRATLYRSAGDKMLFCYLDTHMFGAEFTAAQFWELALTPIREQIVNPSPESPLAEQYRVCRDKQFASFTLGNFFALLRKEGWRLVLLWDEFDVLLYHPILNSAQFFGGLRSVATRSKGALAIVIASRLSLPTLNEQSQQHSRHMGSPYFNYFAEVTLGAFRKEDVEKLFARAGDRFTEEDKRAICTVAGGHPFLLQAAAAAMWEAWQKGLTDGSQRRYEMAWRLYQEHRSHFADSWRLWSPQIRQAFTVVALIQISDLLPDQKVLAKPFAQSLPNYKQELREMEGLGLLVDDDRYEGGYRIAQELMLWWLVDQLMRVVRNEIFFEEWLQRYELSNSRTHQALRQLPKLLNQPELLEHGVSTLIKRFAGVKLKAQPEVPEPNQSKPLSLIDRLKNFFDTLGL